MQPSITTRRLYRLFCTAAVAALLITCAYESPASALSLASSSHWAQRFGGAKDDFGYATATDSQGNVYLAGSFQGTADFGGGALTSAGDHDIYLAKYDAGGSPLWSKRFGDAWSDAAYSLAVDAEGNLYLTGYFTGNVDFGQGFLNSNNEWDIFLVKFDPDGNTLWSKRFGAGGNDYGTGIAIDPTGSVYLTGYLWYGADFGDGFLSHASDNVFVAKFDSGGNPVWSTIFVQTGGAHARDIAVDPQGNVLIAGTFSGTINFGGGILGSGLPVTDIFLAKFTPDGAHVWSKRFDSSGEDYCNSLAVDSAGNIYITGHFPFSIDFGGGAVSSNGFRDIYLVKFSPEGNHVWSRHFGGPIPDYGDSYGYAVEVSAFGGIFLTGAFTGKLDLGGGVFEWNDSPDIFLAQFDLDGNHLWSRQFGGEREDYGNSIATHSSGAVYLTGNFNGTIDFGAGPLASTGRDAFLAKFSFPQVFLPVVYKE